MLNKQQLICMLVGLTRVSDIDLVNDKAVLSHEVCLVSDQSSVRRMAAIVSELYDTFDYSQSPEFIRSIEGKSPEFRAMRQRMLTPMMRTELRSRLGRALEKVLDSEEVLDLIELRRQELIKELRTLLRNLSNPDSSSP